MLSRALAKGKSPLEYMLDTLNDPNTTEGDKRWAAEKSAQFVHPRPMPQPRTVQVKLPDTSTPAGIAEAIGSVIAVTARGRLAPSEARDLVGLLETRLKAFEVLNLEERIALLEKKDRK